MRSRLLTIAAVSVLGWANLALGACRSKECARMEACCGAIESVEGVGNSCDRVSAAVGDPETCKTILETVELMYEEREEEPPEICRAPTGRSGPEQSSPSQ